MKARFAPMNHSERGFPDRHFLIVAGGTRRFHFHTNARMWSAARDNVALDVGIWPGVQGSDFLPSAWLLARVVSKPRRESALVLDLGHKSGGVKRSASRVITDTVPAATLTEENRGP